MKDKLSRIWGDLSKKWGLSTISQCSYDGDNNVYLIESEKEVINFDEVSKELAKELQVNKPSSVDALYIQDDMLHLVEFKNTHNPKPDEVRVKVHDTLAMLKLSNFITDDDYKLIKIILVRKFKATTIKNIRRMKNAGVQLKLKMGLDFLQKVYPSVEFFDMSPDEYKKLINMPNESEVASCTP